MKLYIIGNGFDINHGLPTSYSDFLKYVCLNHHDQFHKFGTMFSDSNPSKLWSDFEYELGNFDVIGSIHRNIKTWDDIVKLYPHDGFLKIGKIIETFRGKLIDLFEMWVKETIIEKHATAKYILDRSDYYLVFNYTNVLNTTYCIDESHTCYIHGNCANNHLRKPEVGHGLSNEKIKEYVNSQVEKIIPLVKKTNFSVENISSEYEELLKLLRKESQLLLEQKRKFFDLVLGFNIESVWILGHSMSEIDSLYLNEINNFIPQETPIFVSYYAKNEIGDLMEHANKYFTNHPISFHKIEDILQPINL